MNLVMILVSKRRCVKIGAKTLRNNFRMKATADEIDVATKPSFGENESGFLFLPIPLPLPSLP